MLFNDTIAQLNLLNSFASPVVTREDIVDRITSGFGPSKQVYHAIIDPSGDYEMIVPDHLCDLQSSVSEIYDTMSAEELQTFKAILAYLYRKKLRDRRMILAAGGATIIAMILGKILKSSI